MIGLSFDSVGWLNKYDWFKILVAHSNCFWCVFTSVNSNENWINTLLYLSKCPEKATEYFHKIHNNSKSDLRQHCPDLYKRWVIRLDELGQRKDSSSDNTSV